MRLEPLFDLAAHALDDEVLRAFAELPVLRHEFLKDRTFRHVVVFRFCWCLLRVGQGRGGFCTRPE